MENPAVAAGSRRPGDRAASNFSATCRMLSQYLKEKGSFGELKLGMVASPFRVEGKPEKLRTLNLLPGVEVSSGAGKDVPSDEKEAVPKNPVKHLPQGTILPDLNREVQNAPMSIFYGGKLVVFNNFPADKAKELMDIAAKGYPHSAEKSAGEKHAPAAVLPTQRQPPPAAATAAPTSETAAATRAAGGAAGVTGVEAAATAAVSKQEETPHQIPQPASSDMPIARRVSLHRFLEKRKDRITSKAPYQVNASSGVPGSSVSPPAKGEEGKDREWLGLGSQGDPKVEVDSPGGWWAPSKFPADSGSGRC